MASTITHAYFMLDVYNELDSKTKKLIMDDKNILKIASQGMDPFFFYRILYFKKGQRMREFGGYFHDNKTYLFFETLINYIKYNGYGRYKEVMAFLYGMLSHYILDSNIHPFVIYKTGKFDEHDKETYKYNMKHEELESILDCYLVSLREHKEPWKFKAYSFVFEDFYISEKLEEVINFTYKEVFDINNMTKFYKRSIKDMKMFYRIFRYDPYKLKHLFYKTVDFICPSSFRRKTPLSYYLKIDYSLFNLHHKVWYNPTTKKEKYHTSILDIYSISVKECRDLILNINKYIYEDEGDLKKILKNVSYVTGRETEKHYSLKYFEF